MKYNGEKLRVRLYDGNSFMISISSPPHEEGGEGFIYKFLHPKYGALVLKLYISEEKAQKNKEKIQFLVNNQISSEYDYIRYCWPIGVVTNCANNFFCGFIMQAAFEGSRDLKILDTYYLNKTIQNIFPDEHRGWYNRYELNTECGLRNRYVILLRWALALHNLHKNGFYVLGDIKPDNVLATSDGKISIIDIDSMQVKTGELFYSSSAHTAEYCPPEVLLHIERIKTIHPSYDYFSMGVSFYSILTGTHPYANTKILSPFDKKDTYNKISDKIKAGLYLRGKNSKYVQTIEPYNLHKNFDILPRQIRILLDRSLSHSPIDRPTAKDWCITLNEVLNGI